MSAIAATNSSARDNLAALLLSRSAAGADAPSPTTAKADTPTKSGDGPAVRVDLSDRAKALLERTKIEQTVADRLDQQSVAAKGDGAPVPASKSTGAASKLLDALSGRSASPATSDTTWEAGSKFGDPSLSDADFIAKYKDTLLRVAGTYSPEKAQSLQSAIANGTVKFQNASEVPDLNYHSTTTYTSGIGGGGIATSSVYQPTGATKDAIEHGNALAFWTEDRGNVYMTW